jgi:two-component system phosphate regulon sensor histidine kinase PhoR
VQLSFATKLRLALLWPAVAALAVVALLLAWILPHRFERAAASELLETTELVAPLVAKQIEGRDTPPVSRIVERDAPLATGQIEGRAEAAAPLAPSAPLQASESLQSWVHGIAGSSRLRVTLIRADGLVLADSAQRDLAGVLAMENHRERPEVRQALQGGGGTSVRRSATTHIAYAYAARTIGMPRHGVVIVRLAAPIRSLALLERQLGRGALLALLAALLAAGLVSWWVRRQLFRPLRALVTGADRFTGGDLAHRVNLPEEAELAAVGAALNRLAEHAEAQVSAAGRERDQLASILASMAEGVLVTDADGRALLANPAFTRLFATRVGVEGKLPIEVAREPALQQLVAATLQSRTPGAADLVLERGERRHVALLAAPLGRGEGSARGVVLVARDVTPFVRLTEVRRDFVANVSHELKTPLAAIRGMAETLRDGALGDAETAHRFVGRILEQCARLQALLEDLLTLSRLESPLGATEPEPVDLAGLARLASEVIGPAAAERGVVVEVSTAEPVTIPGDADALERLLLNLLDNAVKYNGAGGTVWLAIRRDGDQVVVEVRDTGIGIPAEHLPRIFERFYRVDRARSREGGGTGLGLAIVKHVAQLHGGRVEVESEPGKGSTFRVLLPAR